MSKRPSKRAGGDNEPAGKPDEPANDVAAVGDNGDIGGGAGESIIIEATVDPGTIGADPSDIGTDSQPRRRGRPPGPNAGKSKAKISSVIKVTGIEKLLIGIHGGLAILSGREEWMLDSEQKIFDGQTESEFLASSIKSVSDHYGTMVDQKTIDWCNLIQCLAMIYGGRIYAIRSAPRQRSVRPSTVQENASRHNPAPPRTYTKPPVNEYPSKSSEANTVEIPGLGAVVFDENDPLSPTYKPKYN